MNSDKDMDKLMKLLAGFVMLANYKYKNGFSGSMYGVKMDTAMAKDLMTILVAYGAGLNEYLKAKELLKNMGYWEV